MDDRVLGQVLKLYNGSEQGKVCVVSTISLIKNFTEQQSIRFYDGGMELVAPALRELLRVDQKGFTELLNSCIDTLNEHLFSKVELIRE